ncbi:MAG: lysylphosphatidylglycerol synthase transmembrane domain-containing protein [Thermoanaerobaculia bacterium]
MENEARDAAIQSQDRQTMDRFWSYTFSYLLGTVLLGTLIWSSGIWNFLANTRLLSVLINSGVVSYHDAQTGWIRGVPDLKYFLKSQDPVKWGLVEGAALLFLLFWVIKAVQFHALCRFTGARGTFSHHSRFYLEGLGVNRFLPFNQGLVQMARSMANQGASLNRVTQATLLAELFVVIEIVVYAAYGPYGLGWSVWLAQIFWSLVILGLCYLMARPSRLYPEHSIIPLDWKEVKQSFSALARRPIEFSKLTALSLVAFGLEDVAAYMIAMAFTSTHVILNVNFSILLMAIVASYIARLIPVTPGGIGQFEWGFAAGLYLGGLGWPECVTIAFLDNAVRYISGTLLWVWVVNTAPNVWMGKLFREQPAAAAAEE